jgi:hypothetical protein
MKKLGRAAKFVVAVAALCVAPAAFGASTITVTGVGSGNNYGGVYIGPYIGTLNIDGSAPEAGVRIICDDWVGDISVGQTWTVTEHQVGDSANGVYGALSSETYKEAAWLATQLVNPTICGSFTIAANNCATDIQYAIWELFNAAPAPTLPYLTSFNTLQGMAATAVGSGFDSSIVSVYSPDPLPCSGFLPCAHNTQEMLVVRTPEPEAIALMAVDLSGVALLVMFFRKRRKTAL